MRSLLFFILTCTTSLFPLYLRPRLMLHCVPPSRHQSSSPSHSTDPSYQAITLSSHNFFLLFLGNIPFTLVMPIRKNYTVLWHTRPLLYLDNIPPLFPTPYHRINESRGDFPFPLISIYIPLISILSVSQSHRFVDFSCQSSKVFLQRPLPGLG